ncbi:protein S100-B-like [Dermochelys coriacea]|uniref:protein S100-B-like n=1 Tax=Dermochelys coriacea TaxID=27794 RepID=UPI0018E7088E|nr:protein S100-B-like [Dermochelys coriacea]
MEPSCRAQAAPRVSMQRSCRLLDMASSLHQGPALTDLERALLSTMAVFHTYSGCRGSLRKVDLKTLINRELPQFVQEIHDPETLEWLFRDLDTNGNSRSTSRNTPRWSPC